MARLQERSRRTWGDTGPPAHKAGELGQLPRAMGGRHAQRRGRVHRGGACAERSEDVGRGGVGCARRRGACAGRKQEGRAHTIHKDDVGGRSKREEGNGATDDGVKK